MQITDYTFHRTLIPLREPIGDSQVRVDRFWTTVLELHTDEGHTGIGFETSTVPTPLLEEMNAKFEGSAWTSLKGQSPLALVNRITRPRGGNVGSGDLSLLVETALWDLIAKQQGQPLYRVLGGEDPRVRAYASTLDFRLDDDRFREKLQRFRDMGFSSVKTKVAHPDISWDLRRLGIAREVLGSEGDLMIDANEAWSVKETLVRLHRYRDAGFEIFWVEDPITREDYAGYSSLCNELFFARVNTGEYLDYSGKRKLLERNAVDVLNIHGSVTMSRDAARLAGDHGVPVSLGNTILEIGVHLAASLPECLYMEFSDLRWNELAQEPVRFENGHAIAPDRPGHGIELDPDKLAFYSQPD